jgi:dihydrofolate reductase
MIYAVSPEGVIGANGGIPWHHPGDYRRFKRVTLGSTVIMGRKTFESMGKPLPRRRNIVVTSRAFDRPGVECVATLQEGLARAGEGDVWFIGGAGIYAEAMAYADVIDVTYVPDHVAGQDVVHAPAIDAGLFEAGPLLDHEDEPGLKRRVYIRRSPRVGSIRPTRSIA